MAKLSELRTEAKRLGISAATIRSATTAEELQSVIEDHGAHEGGSSVAVKAKAKSKVAKKKTTARKATARKQTRKSTTTSARKPNRNSARKASTPAKSRKSGKAKRSSNSTTRTSGYVAKGGRNVLDDVEYGDFEGWNPRPGSAPDRIVKALKKFRGNRAKVYDFLAPDVWDFVGKTYRNGERRTKGEALEMLAYRISRTAWDFAMRTGQHEIAGNRVKYGTGGTGMGVWKPAKAAKATRKTSAKTTGRKKAGRAKAGSRR